MSNDNNTEPDQLSIHSYDAAGASVAQSIAIAAQDQVDLIRNQNIIKTTAMGSAYAKWLAEPMQGDHFKPIIEETDTAHPQGPFGLAMEVFETYKNQSFDLGGNNQGDDQ